MDVKQGFKQTVVGIIPVDWTTKKIGAIGEVRGRVGWKGYTKKDLVQHGPLAIGAKHIDGQCRLDLSDPTFLSRAKYLESPEIMVQRDDILVVQRGTIGKLVLIEKDIGEATINPSLVIVRTRNTVPSYIRHFLLSRQGQEQISKDVSSTGVPMISQKQIENFSISWPPTTDEQRAISAALSDMDALLDGLDQLIAKKRDLKQAAMQQLLTGRTRLPGFNGKWLVRAFGDLFRFSGGYSASRDQLSADGHCYLHYGDIHGSTRTFIDVRADYHDIPKLNIPLNRVSPNTLLRDGDIVFVDASEDDEGTSRHLVIVNKENVPFVSGLHTIVAKSKTDELAHEYRRYCFQTAAIRQQFLFYAVGTKVTGISKSNIPKLTLPVPPVSEQTAIAAVLSEMDAEIQALEARRDKTRDLKQGMMQELLTGRTRLV